MAVKLTERQRLENELIRIDRTLAIDRKMLSDLKAQIDKLTDYRLEVESWLNALESKQ
jgi:N-methylhydantoinase B/oxoprolinase/acetone carboxylase alpha subunit